MFNVSKKAIGPVVATALLLVVAVVGVVTLQTWFNSYQSGINSKVEVQSEAVLVMSIESFIALGPGGDNATVYIKNTATQSITIADVKVSSSGVSYCDYDGSTITISAATSNSQPSVGWIELGGSNCTVSMTIGETYEIAVISTEGVYQESEILR